jgi:pimeloyl-ACP methyl ester carboxylesterase
MQFAPCEGSSGVRCGTVSVPLDRRGVIPGKVWLHVEQLPADGHPRGVVFVLAGGPGQAGTRVFDLAANGARLRAVFPGYTLVAFDPRGTGESGALRCPSLENGTDFVADMAKCAETIGPAVSSYSTRDHAEDIDAVRAALGVDKIALWGASYGAKLALAYALAHPRNVARLLMDSPLPTTGPDPFGRTIFRSLSRALRSLCDGGYCKGLTRNLLGDLAAVANRLQKSRLRGEPVFVDGQGLLSLALATDSNPGLRAQVPTAIVEARRGRPALLVRLSTPAGRAAPDPTFSLPLYITTTCEDASLPWQPETPLADRERAYEAAVSALPRGAIGPFGDWAAQVGIARYCSFWPPSGPGARLGDGPLPDVPVLVLSGAFDMRTPTESARAISRLFRRGRLVVVPGIGHGVLASDFSQCAERAVHTWLDGARPRSSCAAVRPVLASVGPLAGLPTGRRVPAARAREAVATTLRAAAAAWYTSARGRAGASLPGLYGGRLTSKDGESFSLDRFSDIKGVEVTGRLTAVTTIRGPLVQVQGGVKVTGRRDVRGAVTVSEGRLTGRLGGSPISR